MEIGITLDGEEVRMESPKKRKKDKKTERKKYADVISRSSSVRLIINASP